MTTVQVAKGTVQRLTVDETATNSTVQINRNTEVKELNLDVASSVTGDGDVKQMNINAPGVTSTVLPEKLYIRPGITGNVGGEDLDSAGAEEYSRDPKILSGYPIASDIAPTSLRADFATNKKGTVYWAISNITDGSVSADDLIKPPSYGSAALKLLLPVRRDGRPPWGAQSRKGDLLYYAGQHQARFRSGLPQDDPGHRHPGSGRGHAHQEL